MGCTQSILSLSEGKQKDGEGSSRSEKEMRKQRMKGPDDESRLEARAKNKGRTLQGRIGQRNRNLERCPMNMLLPTGSRARSMTPASSGPALLYTLQIKVGARER